MDPSSLWKSGPLKLPAPSKTNAAPLDSNPRGDAGRAGKGPGRMGWSVCDKNTYPAPTEVPLRLGFEWGGASGPEGRFPMSGIMAIRTSEGPFDIFMESASIIFVELMHGPAAQDTPARGSGAPKTWNGGSPPLLEGTLL